MHSHASDYIYSKYETHLDEDETIKETPTTIIKVREEGDKESAILNKNTSQPVVSASPLLHGHASAPVTPRVLRSTLSRLPPQIAEFAVKVRSLFKETIHKALTKLEPEYPPRVEERWFPPPKPEIGLCILWMLHCAAPNTPIFEVSPEA